MAIRVASRLAVFLWKEVMSSVTIYYFLVTSFIPDTYSNMIAAQTTVVMLDYIPYDNYGGYLSYNMV